MPELPEVETTRRGIEPYAVGRKIVRLAVHEPRLRWPVAKDMPRQVAGQRILATGRRAKYLLFELDSGTLLLHLGMSGSLRVLQGHVPPETHDHWDMRMDSGLVLRFHDPRRFGSLHWTEADPDAHPLLAKLAPEPLTAPFDGDYLYRITRKRAVAIKHLIMNSQLVVGVGNIYASEALFRARISPRRSARRITKVQARALAQAIKDVLSEAIRIGGTTLRDYVNAEGTPGYFRQKLFVYERAGLPCRRCKTPIKQFVQGQRSTYWCPGCQG